MRRAARRPRRWLRRIVAVVVLALAVVAAGGGWYISGEIIESLRVPLAESSPDTDVVAVTEDEITLVPPDTADATADVDAVMGLRWDGGYAQVGPTTTMDDGAQIRAFTVLRGTPPEPGADVAGFHGYAFPSDPAAAGIAVETVTYASPGGDLDAWYLPGDGKTWIIAVHGRGETRAEMFRMVEAIGDLRYPTLIVQYRNDPGTERRNDGVMLVGQEEWVDVRAAVDHALANGAEDVVVYGNSMGGALSLAYAMEEERGVVRGLALDAPMADLREVVRLRSGEALPIGGPVGDALLGAGRLLTWLRVGLDFDTIDYVDRADELDVPVLVFHGRDDRSVPFAVGQSLADARPDLVELHPVPDAAHVRAWNEDPTAYAQVLEGFLGDLGRG